MSITERSSEVNLFFIIQKYDNTYLLNRSLSSINIIKRNNEFSNYMLNSSRIRKSEIFNLITSPLRTLKKNNSSRNIINNHSSSIDLIIPKSNFNYKSNDKKINLKLQRLRNNIPFTKINNNKPILNCSNNICNFNINDYLFNSPTNKNVVKCGLLEKIINSRMNSHKKKTNSFKQILKKQKFIDKQETENFIGKLSIHKKEL